MGCGWVLAHRLSAGCPRFVEAVVPVPRRGGRACVQAAWLAVPAGGGFGDGEAEFLEFGDELADAAVVVEPGGVVVGQDAGGGLATDLKVRRRPPDAAALPFPYIVLVGRRQGWQTKETR
jgi:hypothetical protein